MKQLQRITLPIRSDRAGDGNFGAPRGSRTHRGIDYECTPNDPILSPVEGKVTRLGYPYGDDLSWRYVEVTDSANFQHRVFYVDPLVRVGQRVCENDPIGNAQDISERYPAQGMKPHVHYEIKNEDGRYINPQQ